MIVVRFRTHPVAKPEWIRYPLVWSHRESTAKQTRRTLGDQMYVIRHQEIAEDAEIPQLGVLDEQFEAPATVVVGAKNDLAVIAPLRF